MYSVKPMACDAPSFKCEADAGVGAVCERVGLDILDDYVVCLVMRCSNDFACP